MDWNWSSLSEEKMQFYRQLCPDNEYRVLNLDFELPGVAQSLTKKCTNVVIAASGDNTGRVFYMANLIRPDHKDPKGNAVDQQPFGFVIDSKNQFLSGALSQHGDWAGRTTYPTPTAWQPILNSDFQALASLNIVPPASAGNINELNCNSQRLAFTNLIGALSAEVQKTSGIENAGSE